MQTYLTSQEVMQLSHTERREYIRKIHENTMSNLRKINTIADAEIVLINKIIALG